MSQHSSKCALNGIIIVEGSLLLTLSHALVFSFIVFAYMNLITWKEKNILGIIGLYFGGFVEKLNWFSGFWEHRQNTFKELRNVLSMVLGDQCVTSSEQGNTDPPGGLTHYLMAQCAISFTCDYPDQQLSMSPLKCRAKLSGWNDNFGLFQTNSLNSNV